MEARHDITKIERRDDGATYRVSLFIPLRYEAVAQVKFHVWKNSKHMIYDMEFIRNEQEYAFFETIVCLENFPLYHYYFTFWSDGKTYDYKRKDFPIILIS